MLDGQPFSDGMVSLYSNASGVGAQVPIDAEGKYVVKDSLVLGTYTVAIVPPLPPPPGPPTGAPVKKEKAKIPAKFSNPKTSGLTVEVKKGENTFNIEMK